MNDSNDASAIKTPYSLVATNSDPLNPNINTSINTSIATDSNPNLNTNARNDLNICPIQPMMDTDNEVTNDYHSVGKSTPHIIIYNILRFCVIPQYDISYNIQILRHINYQHQKPPMSQPMNLAHYQLKINFNSIHSLSKSKQK